MSEVAKVLSVFPVNVPAGDSTELKVRGRFVRVMETTAAFELSIDDGRPMTVERGLAIKLPDSFRKLTVIAPAGSSVIATLAITDGEILDTRVTISAEAGLVVNVAATLGAPLQALSNTLTVSGGATPSRAIIAALDTNIEWVELQNRGASMLAVSNANGETGAAIVLDPLERIRLVTGGPLWITNLSATVAGAYAALSGERA
jgi:hypothetical protein